MVKVVKAPELLPVSTAPAIFLAGSIEMGSATDWQTKVTKSLSDLDVVVYNPRRDDWDSSWEQKKDNPQFREQVEWELNALRSADTIIMYFDPNTKSPISLLELGLFAKTRNLIVCCPEGFWRKGNVDIVCEQYNIPQVNSLDELTSFLRKMLK